MQAIQVTYSIRLKDQVFFIDQIADGELDRSFGPYWSLATAQAQVASWEAGTLWGRHWPNAARNTSEGKTLSAYTQRCQMIEEHGRLTSEE